MNTLKPLSAFLFPLLSIAALMAQSDAQSDALKARIDEADPSVIDEIRFRVDSGLEIPIEERHDTLLCKSIIASGHFRDSENVFILHHFYETEMLGSFFQDLVARAIAKIGHPSSSEILRKIVWNHLLSIKLRCQAAATLLELGDSFGGEFLLLQYDLYRLGVNSEMPSRLEGVRENMEHLKTDYFDIRLRERAAIETPLLRRDIQALLDRLALNRLSERELQILAQETSWSVGKQTRYAAIEQLGLYGSPAMIPVLESLALWQSEDPHSATLENQTLKECIQKAVLTLRYRHWQVLAKGVSGQEQE